MSNHPHHRTEPRALLCSINLCVVDEVSGSMNIDLVPLLREVAERPTTHPTVRGLSMEPAAARHAEPRHVGKRAAERQEVVAVAKLPRLATQSDPAAAAAAADELSQGTPPSILSPPLPSTSIHV